MTKILLKRNKLSKKCAKIAAVFLLTCGFSASESFVLIKQQYLDKIAHKFTVFMQFQKILANKRWFLPNTMLNLCFRHHLLFFNNLVVGENAVENEDKFVYLESVFTSDGYCCPDINRCRPSIVSNVITPTHLEEPTPLTHYKNMHLPCPIAVRIIICSQNLVSALHQFKSPQGLSYEVSRELLQIKWHQFI